MKFSKFTALPVLLFSSLAFAQSEVPIHVTTTDNLSVVISEIGIVPLNDDCKGDASTGFWSDISSHPITPKYMSKKVSGSREFSKTLVLLPTGRWKDCSLVSNSILVTVKYKNKNGTFFESGFSLGTDGIDSAIEQLNSISAIECDRTNLENWPDETPKGFKGIFYSHDPASNFNCAIKYSAQLVNKGADFTVRFAN
jgi:hypothetical protein